MKAGQTVNRLVTLQVATGVFAGAALNFASAAAAIAVGWGWTWYDSTGAALSSQPAYTLSCIDSANGIHVLSYPLPGNRGYVKTTIPSGYRADPAGWSYDGLSYDDDAIAGLLLTAQGVPAVNSADDGDLGDVVSADAYNSGTLYIPSGKLSKFGLAFSDLSGFSISAGAKSAPADTMVALTCAFGATYLTDGAFTFSWNTMDPAMQLDAATYAKTWFIDVQIKQTASPNKLITTNRYSINVKWQRDTVT